MTKGDDDDCRSNFTKSEDGDESLTGLAPSIYGTLEPTDDRFGRQLLRGLRLSESAVHRGEKLLVIKRLGEKRNCARLHGVPFIVRTFAACYDYHTRLTTDRGEVCLHFQAGHSNHPNVEDYQLHTMHLDVSKESLCFVKAARRDSIRSQQISK